MLSTQWRQLSHKLRHSVRLTPVYPQPQHCVERHTFLRDLLVPVGISQRVALQHRWLIQATPSMPALPKMVLDRCVQNPKYRFFNVLPEIGRCWASIDNCLFLWRLGEKCALSDLACIHICLSLVRAWLGAFHADRAAAQLSIPCPHSACALAQPPDHKLSHTQPPTCS